MKPIKTVALSFATLAFAFVASTASAQVISAPITNKAKSCYTCKGNTKKPCGVVATQPFAPYVPGVSAGWDTNPNYAPPPVQLSYYGKSGSVSCFPMSSACAAAMKLLIDTDLLDAKSVTVPMSNGKEAIILK